MKDSFMKSFGFVMGLATATALVSVVADVFGTNKNVAKNKNSDNSEAKDEE